MSNKIFDHNLVVIRKSKLPLKLNKPTYSGMCILELSKKIILEYTNSIMIVLKINMTTDQSYYSQTNSLIYEIKIEDVYKGFSCNKEKFDFSNYSHKSTYYDNARRLAIWKMKDETGDVAIEEFVGLKPNMYSFLADNSERWKTRDVDKNVIATASHNEYKDVLLNNKCIRDPINRIQSKGHIIGTNEINRIS